MTARSVCDERRAGVGVAERRVAARDLGQVGAGLEPSAREQPADSLADRERRGRGRAAAARARSRAASRAQQRVDLAAEAAAGDEHEALAALGELVGELHRDPAAERVADDGRAVVPEREHQVAHAAGVGAERVVAARLGRLAVAEQVGREHGVGVGELLDRVAPTAPRAR